MLDDDKSLVSGGQLADNVDLICALALNDYEHKWPASSIYGFVVFSLLEPKVFLYITPEAPKTHHHLPDHLSIAIDSPRGVPVADMMLVLVFGIFLVFLLLKI